MELANPIPAARAANKILESFRKSGLPVIHINHVSTKPGSRFFLPGTEGIEVHPLVKPVNGETVLIKHLPNSFLGTGLEGKLSELNAGSLIITGMMTHMCVDATTRAATDLGFECIVISDACATKDLRIEDQVISHDKVHGAFLAALNGTYAKVMKSPDFIADMKGILQHKQDTDA